MNSPPKEFAMVTEEVFIVKNGPGTVMAAAVFTGSRC